MRAKKAHAKNLKNKTEIEVEAPRECLFLDATGLFQQSIGGSQLDAKIVDQFFCKTWTAHIKSKAQVVEMVKQHLDTMNGQGKLVKYLYCDNASKHGTKLANIYIEWGIENEFMAPCTPQHSGLVKCKITDQVCSLAMLFDTHLTETAQALLQAEAEAMTMCLSNSLELVSQGNSQGGNTGKAMAGTPCSIWTDWIHPN